jgi:hypothetical protein
MIQEKPVPPRIANEVQRIALVVPKELLKRIGAWRKRQEDFPTLSDAVRRLITDQLDALDKASDKPKPLKKG